MDDSILLRIAKTAILNKFGHSREIDEDALLNEYPFLAKDGFSDPRFNSLHVELLDYRTSADTTRVVGYMSGCFI